MMGCQSDRSLTLIYVLLRKGPIWIQKFNAMVRFYIITFLVVADACEGVNHKQEVCSSKNNYQSSEHESSQHDESDMVKFPCTLKNALLIIRDRFGLSFATKGLGYLDAIYLPLPLLLRYKLSCYQTTCYRLFQCLQKIPC